MNQYLFNIVVLSCIGAYLSAVYIPAGAAAAEPALPTWKPSNALEPTGGLERRDVKALGFELYLPGNHYPSGEPPTTLDWSLDVVQSVQIDGQPFQLLPVVDSGADAPGVGRVQWIVLHSPNESLPRLTAPVGAKYALDSVVARQGATGWPAESVTTKPELGLIRGFKFARTYFKEPMPGADGQPKVLHGMIYAAALDGDILALIGTTLEDKEGAYKKTLASLEAHILTIHRQVGDESLANLVKIATATLACSIDLDETLPPMQTTAAFKKAVMPYIQSNAVFVCPSTGLPYRVNRSLSRLHLSQIPAPALTILAYEASPAKDGTRGVVFMDAHATRIPESQWPALKRASRIP